MIGRTVMVGLLLFAAGACQKVPDQPPTATVAETPDPTPEAHDPPRDSTIQENVVYWQDAHTGCWYIYWNQTVAPQYTKRGTVNCGSSSTPE